MDVKEFKKLVNDYNEKSVYQRSQQLIQYKRNKEMQKFTIYAMIAYKDIVSQRALKNLQ